MREAVHYADGTAGDCGATVRPSITCHTCFVHARNTDAYSSVPTKYSTIASSRAMQQRAKKHAGMAGALHTAHDLIAAAKRRITQVSCQEAVQRLANTAHPPVLVDVREEYEYEMVRLAGGVHISRGVLEMEIEHEYPDRDTPLLLYCSRGDRSALAALTLQQLGYRDVASIGGGLHAWQEQGLPVILPRQEGGSGSGI